MDGHEHQPLSDEALEREIEAAFTVDPSPEFLARVRARVAASPAPSAWRFRWQFAVVPIAGVIIAAAVVWHNVEPRPSDKSNQVPLVAENAPRPASPGAASRVVTLKPPAEPATRGAGVAQARRTPEAHDPFNDLTVLVAPEDVRGFELLLSSIREPDVVLLLNDDTTGPVALSAPSIEIAPIDIEPVPPIAQLEGGVE